MKALIARQELTVRKSYLCCTRPTTKAKKMGFSKYLALKSEID